jgi:molecular chaperone DnaK (HSP70)
MLDAIEKMRKTLSANSDTSLSIDYNHTREELETLILPMVLEIRKTF